MKYTVPRGLLEMTYLNLRLCGAQVEECQLFWLSHRAEPQTIRSIVHPIHKPMGHGFELDDQWLSRFWVGLANEGMSIRVQVHTHPNQAFHSQTDDEWPAVHSIGFLSLVIPRFAQGDASLANAYLAELREDGTWSEVSIAERLEVL